MVHEDSQPLQVPPNHKIQLQAQYQRLYTVASPLPVTVSGELPSYFLHCRTSLPQPFQGGDWPLLILRS